MRILMAHNFYREAGGEDQVFAAESRLLESRGHTVVRVTRSAVSLESMSRSAIVRASIWNWHSWREMRQIIRREDIEMVHFHNTFPLLSPSVYYAAHAESVPVVQSLHNFRLLCPGATFYRDGQVCEDCTTRSIPWPSVRHACYHDSVTQSGAVAGMLAVHRAARTWSRMVDLYVALTEFARDKFVSGGLPEHNIKVKANFLDKDPGVGVGQGNYTLFVGRLTADKGVECLLEAWKRLPSNISLKVVGNGPLMEFAIREARFLPHVEILGSRTREEIFGLMHAAKLLVVPSLWYEGLPMAVVEAYACGLPVIASDLGSLSSLVSDGITGLRFPPGNPAALADRITSVYGDDSQYRDMRAGARKRFMDRYSSDQGYANLIATYDQARDNFAESHKRSNLARRYGRQC